MDILLVDDSRETLDALSEVVAYLGHAPHIAANGDEALARCREHAFPLIFTDLRMPGMDGLTFLARVRETEPNRDADVVIVTGHGDLNTAIDALRRGAYDYLNKPVNARELAAVIDRSAERQALLHENRELNVSLENRVEKVAAAAREDAATLRQRLRHTRGIGAVVAESATLREALSQARVFHADPTVPILIEGETGTGKEIVAHLIHYGEDGDDGRPFVDINCTALSPELADSELFGYAKGAFTGGQADGSAGKLELAADGTLFLDEIGDMPLVLQPKLLRVLQERTYYRVGGLKKLSFSARIIGATNRPFESLLAEGRFRRDLFHRMEMGRIRIPPLRERPEDIVPLARHFLAEAARLRKKRFAAITPRAEALLAAHPWPGNVRELQNAVERVTVLFDDSEMDVTHLAFLVAAPGTPPTAPSPTRGAPLAEDGSLALPPDHFDIERHYDAVLREAMRMHDNNKSRAARYLNISRHALQRRLDKIDGHTPDNEP